MKRSTSARCGLLFCLALLSLGCHASPYRSDQGALFGGLLGAGTGALLADAAGGSAGTGALIGAGAGAITGAIVGDELDQIEAQNRAQIEAQLGRQLAAGSVRLDEVVAMSKAGVDEGLIINHIHAHGVERLPTTDDVIFLSQSGVSTNVIKVMQTPQPRVVRASAAPAPPPVIIEEHHYGYPACYPRHHWHGHRPPHRFNWGFSFHSR